MDVIRQVGAGGGFDLGEEGRGVLLHQAVQGGLLGAVALVVDRGAIGRPAGLLKREFHALLAPNRRFPDLITLRMLKALLAGAQPPYSLAELDALARHCSAQEDAAQKVERRVRKSVAALLLESHVGQQYDAIVTGRKANDTWVRTLAPPVEGKLMAGAGDLEVGQQVRVKLVATDVERGFIDFVQVD